MGVANITVEYLELGDDHGLAGGADENGEWERKPYLVAWGDRGNFINQLAGSTAMSGGLGGRIIQYLPYQLPDNPRLYFRSCDWKPEGRLIAGTSPIAYTHAIVTAEFRQPSWNFQTGDDPNFFNSLSQDPAENEALLYATQELSFAREFMTLPNESVKFKSDNRVPKTSKGRSVLVVTATITFHQVPILPFAILRRYADSVNDRTFLGCPKGTVYFGGPQTSQEKFTNGTRNQKLQLVFKWRQFDWNKYLRDDGISWDYLVDASYAGGPTGNSDYNCSYSYNNFLNLLNFLPPS